MGGHLNKRELSKLNTREHIFKVAQHLIEEKGLVKVSTKDISTQAEVAQGSIFLHFNTKKELFFTIYSTLIETVDKTLSEKCSLNLQPDEFIRKFLEVHMTYEGILSRMIKDYSYMQSELKTKVDNFENDVKNLLFDFLRKNNVQKLSIVNSFIVIDAFYAQVKDYLREKTIYTESNEYLKQKQGRLVKLSKILFGF